MAVAYIDHPDKVRYPVGNFGIDPDVTSSKRRQWLRQMAEMPQVLAAAVRGLDERQLGTPYREGGWTPRQVVHHLAETADGREAPVAMSLRLLAALHQRWTILLESLAEEQFGCAFSHPQRGVMTMDKAIQLYAWHGIHHAAHITGLRARMGW